MPKNFSVFDAAAYSYKRAISHEDKCEEQLDRSIKLALPGHVLSGTQAAYDSAVDARVAARRHLKNVCDRHDRRLLAR
ncbi:MAG TPA: hypothetical protein VGG64_27250 [Pirellulales bacterium]|jgi:hypothetical protein